MVCCLDQPELFEQVRTLKSIRDEIHHRVEQLHHCAELQERMENVKMTFDRSESMLIFSLKEIVQYERTNEPLRTQIFSYRVPSIIDYVNLKAKQLQLHHQLDIWQRKVELVEREVRLRRLDLQRHPERIFHPWKSIGNPSSILVEQFCSEPSGT